jgi:hypothetical protein
MYGRLSAAFFGLSALFGCRLDKSGCRRGGGGGGRQLDYHFF